jgi:hypothetical protein
MHFSVPWVINYLPTTSPLTDDDPGLRSSRFPAVPETTKVRNHVSTSPD